MTLDFMVTTQTEMFLKDYVDHHTHQGKYHGSKMIKQLYYKFKAHNLSQLRGHLEIRPVDSLYSKRAKRVKDLGGVF